MFLKIRRFSSNTTHNLNNNNFVTTPLSQVTMLSTECNNKNNSNTN